MQLSRINSSVNFKSNNQQSNTRQTGYEQADEHLNKAKKQASQDIHPATIFAGLATFAGLAIAGKKGVKFARKIAVTAGEYAAVGITKLAGKMKVIKQDKVQKGINKIQNIATSLRGEKENEGLMELVKGVSTRVLGENKGKAAQDFLRAYKIVNVCDVVDATVAGIVAVEAMDKSVDSVEAKLDEVDIAKAEKEAQKIKTAGLVKESIEVLGNLSEAIPI